MKPVRRRRPARKPQQRRPRVRQEFGPARSLREEETRGALVLHAKSRLRATPEPSSRGYENPMGLHAKSRLRATPEPSSRGYENQMGLHAKSRLRASRRMTSRSGPRAMHIAVPTNERGACLREYQRSTYIHKGGWGEVFVGCRGPSDCRYAIKVTRIASDRDLQVAQRDGYFLKKLANLKIDGERAVPEYYDDWFCPTSACKAQGVCPAEMGRKDKGIYVLITARFDHLNCFQTAVRAAINAGLSDDPNEEIGLYERADLLRIYRLAYGIGSRGKTVLSDEKPDQHLRRGHLIVATDFGFAGDVGPHPTYIASSGWFSNEKSPPEFGSCPEVKIPVKTPELAALFNVFNLEAYLVAAGPEVPTYVRNDDGTIHRFVGVEGFAAKLDTWRPGSFDATICPGFTSEYRKILDLWKRMRDYPTSQFTWRDISHGL
jgi:hypothetical protein